MVDESNHLLECRPILSVAFLPLHFASELFGWPQPAGGHAGPALMVSKILFGGNRIRGELWSEPE